MRSALAALCCLLALMAPAGADEATTPQAAIHLLNRLGFGPSLDDLRHVEAVGIDRYIDEQLDPQAIPEPAELTQRLALLDTLQLDPAQLFEIYGPPPPVGGVKPPPDAFKAQRQKARVIFQQAAEARLLRAVMSHRQLQEAMVDFWFDHFNISVDKGLDRLWVGAYEREAIRPHVFGHFRDLLLATFHHPAILVYLDNAQNAAPGSPGPRGKETGLNENYAREVMELHTLGVDGGYTQADVIALARVLTGWGLDYRDLRAGNGPPAVFKPQRHDVEPKTLLGHQIQASGEGEAEEALDLLARSPATARHIAFQLAQYFVADSPPPALVERLAARFTATDGDIKAVLHTLFTSPEFRDSRVAKYKTPYHFVISAVRAAGVPVLNVRPLLGAMAQLGMPLYRCQTPDGYKNTEAAWLSPDATTRRISLAMFFARGGGAVSLPPPPDPPVAQLVAASAPASPPPRGEAVDPVHLEAVLGPSLSPRTKDALAAAPPELRAALILGSPDFMQR